MPYFKSLSVVQFISTSNSVTQHKPLASFTDTCVLEKTKYLIQVCFRITSVRGFQAQGEPDAKPQLLPRNLLEVGPASMIVGNLVAGKRIAQASGRELAHLEDSDQARKVTVALEGPEARRP